MKTSRHLENRYSQLEGGAVPTDVQGSLLLMVGTIQQGDQVRIQTSMTSSILLKMFHDFEHFHCFPSLISFFQNKKCLDGHP